MNRKARTRALAAGAVLAALGVAAWWHERDVAHFLPREDTGFIARFAPPPAAASQSARLELDELLAMQAGRTPADEAAARDDRKTEVARFYGALGLGSEPPPLPRVERLAERVEVDVRMRVRMVKDHYRRLRPYEIEPRLEPCIDDVRGDLSYPSGHAAYAWAMAGMLSDLVPERRQALEQRASEFARQRMVCGVHFPSDLAAGKQAAEWVLHDIRSTGAYSIEAAEASAELRQALKLPVQRPAVR